MIQQLKKILLVLIDIILKKKFYYDIFNPSSWEKNIY
jgi:hypothetical protein